MPFDIDRDVVHLGIYHIGVTPARMAAACWRLNAPSATSWKPPLGRVVGKLKRVRSSERRSCAT
jgi:hypothetical protein